MTPDPSPADVQALAAASPNLDWEHAAREALAQLDRLRQAGDALAEELARWGWGDMHYGPSPQERSVIDALAAWRDATEDGES